MVTSCNGTCTVHAAVSIMRCAIAYESLVQSGRKALMSCMNRLSERDISGLLTWLLQLRIPAAARPWRHCGKVARQAVLLFVGCHQYRKGLGERERETGTETRTETTTGNC